MGRLHVAAVECNYQEIDRQLKGQFSHGLNDKHVLEKIIKELTVTRNDDHIIKWGSTSLSKKSRGTKGVGSSVRHANRVKAVQQGKNIKKAKRRQC